MKNFKHVSHSFIILISSFILIACARGPLGLTFGDSSEDALSSKKSVTLSQDQLIGWSEVNRVVFSLYCNSCHNNNKKPNLTGYDEYRLNIDAVKNSVLVKKNMPRKKTLTNEELQLVQDWIDQGAPLLGREDLAKKPETPVPQEPRLPVTFENLKKEFYEAKCTACHAKDNEEGLTDYSTYDKVKSSIGTILATTTIYVTMPPPPPGHEEEIGEANTNQLSRVQKEMINTWILDGMKEK